MAAKYPLTNKANKYGRDVVSGKIDVCLYIIQACQRHLDDLGKVKQKDYLYTFDKEKSEKFLKFAHKMVHTKGKWQGQPFTLEPWQCFMGASIFGWVKKSDGLRRFRLFYGEIPRKNGKSPFAAIVGNYMFVADGENAAEVYSGAGGLKQALEVFEPAWLMAEKNKGYSKKFGIKLGGTLENPKSMYSLNGGSRVQPIVGNPGDGSSVSCGIVDEYHEHKDDRLFDCLDTGTIAREQPLIIVITTAGTDMSYPCYALRGRVKKILSGEIQAENIFGVIYTIDEKTDDWTDFEVWKKANPNFGVSIFEDGLRAKYETAIQVTRKQNILKCKHLNVWANAGEAWMDMIAFDKCADPTLNIEDFKNDVCYPGVDLASKIDIASKMNMFKRGDDYYLFSNHYTTEAKLDGEDQAHYKEWKEDGFLNAHMGSRIDIQKIENALRQDAKDFNLSGSENGGGEICADEWNAQQLTTNLLNSKVEVVEIPQTVRGLSEPMKELEAVVLSGNFYWDGNPVTRWMFSNVCCYLDENDNIFPRKENKNSKAKIDGAVATINAMARAMYDPGITQCQGNDGSLI